MNRGKAFSASDTKTTGYPNLKKKKKKGSTLTLP